jgi:F420-dependent oxidoreductase-like protein
MIEIALMIEGQNGLNWTRWQRLARAAEDLGFAGLFRSDHYTNSNPPDLDSLELWVSLTWLASHTRRIRFGPLVSPLSFRHPTHTARMAAAIDDLSGGRLTLGLGAGWQEREHQHYGWELLDIPQRFMRFEEGLQIIRMLLTSDTPVSFTGKYFAIQDAILLPRPKRPGGPPILIGGNGERFTFPLAARYADEWNGIYLTPQQYMQSQSKLDRLLIQEGRQPEHLRRSLMTGCIFGKTEEEVRQKAYLRSQGKSNPQELRQRGLVIGAPDEIIQQIIELDHAGVQMVMLQWLDLEDITGLETFGSKVLPHFISDETR